MANPLFYVPYQVRLLAGLDCAALMGDAVVSGRCCRILEEQLQPPPSTRFLY